jgi:virginiamycin B lyase
MHQIFQSTLIFGLATITTLGAAAATDGKFTMYPVPGAPCDTTQGPDGAEYSEEILGNKLARIDPITGIVKEYDIPWTTPLLPNTTIPKVGGISAAISCALVSGYDGKLYASNGLRNQLAVLDLDTEVVSIYDAPNPLGNLQPLNDITANEDGIWFTQTTDNSIGFFDYYTHEMKTYKVPTLLSIPVGIYHASDGGIWFLELVGNKVGRLDPGTGVIVEYDVPLSLSQPFTMRAETEGKYIWFAAFTGNSIGRVTLATGEMKAFPIPTPLSTPVEVCADNSGNIWFTHVLMKSLGKLDPSTGEVTEVALPNSFLGDVLPVGLPPSVAVGIFCKPGNNVWFGGGLSEYVGRYSLD